MRVKETVTSDGTGVSYPDRSAAPAEGRLWGGRGGGRDVVARLALVVVWSSGFLSGKLGLRHSSPYTFAALRFAVAGGLLLAIGLITRQKRLEEFFDRTLAAFDVPPATAYHLEVFHTPDDRLVLCEIASRVGGDRIPVLTRATYGVDLHATSLRSPATCRWSRPRPARPPRCTDPSRSCPRDGPCGCPAGRRSPG
ncbi:EamA family transporter [Streptomyces sp. NPDC007172]|uniref:EamA family transporter n=1 Tax=Streptomyces sp. NPDC007172 TaxID=3364776 RepID=UPI0036747888